MNLLAPVEAKTPVERRNAIVALEATCRELPQEDCPLREHWAPGLYSREIFMRKGLCVVGKIHKHAHMNVVSKGKCLVVTEDGERVIEAGETWVSLPGTKRSVYVIEDVLWTTVHANPTESRDTAWLESQLIASSFESIAADNQLKVAA